MVLLYIIFSCKINAPVFKSHAFQKTTPYGISILHRKSAQAKYLLTIKNVVDYFSVIDAAVF